MGEFLSFLYWCLCGCVLPQQWVCRSECFVVFLSRSCRFCVLFSRTVLKEDDLCLCNVSRVLTVRSRSWRLVCVCLQTETGYITWVDMACPPPAAAVSRCFLFGLKLYRHVTISSEVYWWQENASSEHSSLLVVWDLWNIKWLIISDHYSPVSLWSKMCLGPLLTSSVLHSMLTITTVCI